MVVPQEADDAEYSTLSYPRAREEHSGFMAKQTSQTDRREANVVSEEVIASIDKKEKGWRCR
jgi:hypothetical protein